MFLSESATELTFPELATAEAAAGAGDALAATLPASDVAPVAANDKTLPASLVPTINEVNQKLRMYSTVTMALNIKSPNELPFIPTLVPEAMEVPIPSISVMETAINIVVNKLTTIRFKVTLNHTPNHLSSLSLKLGSTENAMTKGPMM